MKQTAGEFMSRYERATDSHDLDGVLSMIDDDAIYLFSDESVHVGRQAVERVLRRNFDLIQDESYSIDNLRWLASSDEVAACVYDFSWSGTIKGQEASGSGRGTSVIRRLGNEWKVVHEHLSRGSFAA
ncbi:MAG: YybH family protein [Thermoplasmata archaeon]